MAMRLDQVKRTVRLTSLSSEMPFDVASLQNSARSKGHAVAQGESVSATKGVSSPINESHFDYQGESRGVGLQTDSPNKGSQFADQRESLLGFSGVTSQKTDTSNLKTPEHAEAKGVTSDSNHHLTPFDRQTDSPEISNCLPLIGKLTPLNDLSNGSQLASDSPSSATCLPLQRESVEDRKGSQLRAARALGGLRQKTLSYLLKNQEQTALNHTTRLKREDVAKAVQTTEKTLRTIIRRLEEDGYVVRQGSIGGRGEAGIVFRVTETGEKALKGSQIANAKGVKQGESVPTLVSSSFNDLSKTTTTDKDRALRFQNASERFGLNDKGIGANDLMHVWRKGIFQSEEDFIASLEHIAFYLDLPEAKTLTHPKAWLTSQLTKGFYPAPAGFKSWEERQLEAKLSAHREKLARIEALRREEQDLAFSVWLAELDDDARRRMLAGTAIDNIKGKAAEAVLREKFSEEIV